MFTTKKMQKGTHFIRHKFAVFSLMALLTCPVNSVFADVADAIDRPATVSTLGAHSTLLGADNVANNLIAVGERGLILISKDEGRTWEQQPSPVSVTLTDVRFFDDKNGYAIGHGGIVLRTSNGGLDWQIKVNGSTLANQLLEEAKASKDEEAIRQAEFFVEDGPDKPFLDMLVLGPDHLVVVGAYGYAFESTDGGQSWISWMDRIDNYFGLHLYSIRKQGDRILIAGEQGFIALSLDAGQTFETIETFYEGSYFTSQLIGDEGIVLAGLRGNAYVSHDNAFSWNKVTNPISASITSSFIRSDGQIVMANQAGILLDLKDNVLVPESRKSFPPITNVLETKNGGILALSIRGPISIDAGNLK